MERKTGHLLVLTGPSGVGKGLLRKYILSEIPWLKESVSATTRPMRPGEVEGQDYFFVSQDQFQRMIQENELIEWAQFAGNFYGTPSQFLKDTISGGESLLLEIEVEGALNIRKLFSEAHLIFIEPPSLQALEERLNIRNTNTPDDIQRRLQRAGEELAQKSLFDVVICNDQLEVCKMELLQLIQSILSKDQVQAFNG